MRTLARPMLALGLFLWAYIFVVSALSYWAGVRISDGFLVVWKFAVGVSPALVVLGSVLWFAPRVLKPPSFKGTEVALVFEGVVLLVVVSSLCPAVYYSCFATRTEGRIVALHPTSKGGLVTELEYEAAGRTYRIQPHHERTRQSAPEYAVGDTLPVLYQPDVPEVAVVGTFGEMWSLPIFASVMATVILAILLASRPGRPRHQATFYYGYVVIDQRP
ncbi:MAG TPA: DUF3592 domain-containing protein [Gemmataceae bacterium]|nr:DUF3592 domain-containing protein [Gemmataceae bacterium]